MKNLFKFIVPAVIATVALVSCQQEIGKDETSDENAISIRVYASADEVNSDNPSSKTYIDGTKIKWGTGEYMKIGVFDGTATTFDDSTGETADRWNGEDQAFFNFSITPANASGEYTYYGLYPASSAVASSNTNPASYKVNLPSSQSATALSYDPRAYILVARPDPGHNAANADWTAFFRRATALNRITLKNLSEDIKRVTITAPTGTYLAGARHIDLTTGASGDIYSGGGRTETVDVRYASKLSGGANMDIWFTSWDAEIPVGQHLVIVAYSDTHTFTRDLTVVNKSITFKEGYLNTLSVNMSSAIQGDNTEIDEGDYLVLAKDGENYYALKAEKEDGKERLLSVAYTGSRDSYYGDADLIWSLTKSGDSFIFENSSKYLGHKGSSNESYWLEADENWTEDNYLLDVTAQGGASDPYYVTLHSNGSRYLSKNSSSAFFAFYGNTGQKADIVFVPATVDNRTVATLSFAEDAIALTTANYDSFLGQDVTASPNVAAITGNLTWDYEDNDGVIDEFDNGTLTLTGDEGTATVTVSFEGDENYRPAEASYTIEVTSSGSVTLTESEITVGANTVKGTNNGKLAYRLGTSSNDGSLTFDAGYSSITFTLAGWASGTRSFSITNGTIDSSASLSPAAGSPSGTINANFSTTYEGTEYTIVVTDPNAEVVFSGRRCVVWGFTATLQDSRSSAPIAWKKGEDTRTTASVKKVDAAYTWLDPDGAQPTLTITTPLDKAVTYSSSVPSVATINSSTGIISLAGEGSTEIKATYAGAAGDTYKHTEVSYTLTVTPYYTVTFNRTPSNGSFNVKNGETTISTGAVVPAGATINITDITPESGYALSTLVYNDGSDHDIKSAKTFTMPAHAVSVSATFEESGGGGTKEYTLTITASDFNSTSYVANNNEKTSNAVASDSSTYEVKWTSYQVMLNSSNMQWQKSKGYIYNSTDLGTIKSVTVNSSAGSFTTYYGTTAQPDSGTAGSGKGYFKTSVGGATGTTSSVVIVFEI